MRAAVLLAQGFGVRQPGLAVLKGGREAEACVQYCRIPSGGGDARTNGAGKGGCVLAVCVFCGGRGGGGAGGGRWCQTGRRRGEVQYTGCRRSRFFVPALGGGWGGRRGVALPAPPYGLPACVGLVHVESWRAVVGAYGARPLHPALVGETQDGRGARRTRHTGDRRRWGGRRRARRIASID